MDKIFFLKLVYFIWNFSKTIFFLKSQLSIDKKTLCENQCLQNFYLAWNTSEKNWFLFVKILSCNLRFCLKKLAQDLDFPVQKNFLFQPTMKSKFSNFITRRMTKILMCLSMSQAFIIKVSFKMYTYLRSDEYSSN